MPKRILLLLLLLSIAGCSTIDNGVSGGNGVSQSPRHNHGQYGH